MQVLVVIFNKTKKETKRDNNKNHKLCTYTKQVWFGIAKLQLLAEIIYEQYILTTNIIIKYIQRNKKVFI